MQFSYDLLKSPNGGFIRQKNIIKNFPEDYKKLMEYCEANGISDISFPEKLWIYFHDTKGIPKCKCCDTNVRFESYNYGYKTYCSMKCTANDKEWNDKRKQTNLERYGCEEVTSSKKVQEKRKETLMERYGVENPMEIEGSVEKIKKTTLINHGVENAMYLEKFKNKSRKTHLENQGGKATVNPIIIEHRNQQVLDNYNQMFPHDNFIGVSGEKVEIECSKCSKSYNIRKGTYKYRLYNKKETCTHCNPIGTQDSYIEKTLADFVESLGFSIIKNDRNLIKPKEIDILIPEKKLAIELNGLLWHSDKYTTDDYHLNKTILCNEQGYHLLHIFEDEWINKTEIVKSIIKNQFGIIENKIFARKCNIVEVNSSDSKRFLEDNHIQGHVNSSIKLGLEFNGELVALMTFGSLRKSLGQSAKSGDYELLRFCCKLNTIVIGGASRLFKNFVVLNNPQNIISYANRRYFCGNVYKNLGMDFVGESKPNYFYYNGKDLIRENRFKYRKSELVSQGFDENSTEREIMENRGYYRIYDCGTFKYKWLMK